MIPVKILFFDSFDLFYFVVTLFFDDLLFA